MQFVVSVMNLSRARDPKYILSSLKLTVYLASVKHCDALQLWLMGGEKLQALYKRILKTQKQCLLFREVVM